jgi:hypothetical protein
MTRRLEKRCANISHPVVTALTTHKVRLFGEEEELIEQLATKALVTF